MTRNLVLLMLSCVAASLSGCGTPPPPAISAACGWESVDRPSPGFETRWTHEEKLWAVNHNDKVAKFCGLAF